LRRLQSLPELDLPQLEHRRMSGSEKESPVAGAGSEDTAVAAAGGVGDAPAGSADIQLGFIENTEPWKLISRFFPSKVGGRPAWLELKRLPDPDQLRCGHCSSPLVFLCQMYAPDETRPACYHRSLFLFVCRTPACSQQTEGGVLALRSQLSLDNAQYPDSPLEERPVVGEDPYSAAHHVQLCAVCGCRGPKQCAGCKKVHYCSREHQTIDWKHGHKHNCKESGGAGGGAARVLLPEAEIVVEEEPADNKGTQKSEAQRMADFAAMRLQQVESLPDADVGELDKMASSEAAAGDAAFARFRKRVARAPEQVVRYWRDGAPLWVSATHVPGQGDVPACRCGAPRRFEFQILPQLLNHLDLDEVGESVDWGTLAVFTCSASCDPASGEGAYLPEVVWKQQL